MKIAFIVLAAVLCLLILLLILPLTVDLSYENTFAYRIKYAGFCLLDSEKRVDITKKKRRKRKDKKGAATKTETPPKKDNFFKKTYKEKGFFGTVKYFSALLAMLLKKLWFIVKRLNFSKFLIELTVATPDAADTAIKYGEVCAAVYPVLSLLQTTAKFKSKQVNINADFDKTAPEFKASVSVTTRLIFWLIAAISALTEFLKLQHKDCENNERK